MREEYVILTLVCFIIFLAIGLAYFSFSSSIELDKIKSKINHMNCDQLKQAQAQDNYSGWLGDQYIVNKLITECLK